MIETAENTEQRATVDPLNTEPNPHYAHGYSVAEDVIEGVKPDRDSLQQLLDAMVSKRGDQQLGSDAWWHYNGAIVAVSRALDPHKALRD